MYNSISYVVPIFNEELNINNTVNKIIESFDKNNLKSTKLFLLMMDLMIIQ